MIDLVYSLSFKQANHGSYSNESVAWACPNCKCLSSASLSFYPSANPCSFLRSQLQLQQIFMFYLLLHSYHSLFLSRCIFMSLFCSSFAIHLCIFNPIQICSFFDAHYLECWGSWHLWILACRCRLSLSLQVD